MQSRGKKTNVPQHRDRTIHQKHVHTHKPKHRSEGHQKQQPETRNKFAHLHRRFVNDNNVENYTHGARHETLYESNTTLKKKKQQLTDTIQK